MEKHEQVVDTTITEVLSLQQQLRGKEVDIGRLTQEAEVIKDECARIANEKGAIIARVHERVAQLETTLESTKEDHITTQGECTRIICEKYTIITGLCDCVAQLETHLASAEEDHTKTKDERDELNIKLQASEDVQITTAVELKQCREERNSLKTTAKVAEEENSRLADANGEL
jgi:chromosome segregation ATPase